jgi:hypothetical protein
MSRRPERLPTRGLSRLPGLRGARPRPQAPAPTGAPATGGPIGPRAGRGAAAARGRRTLRPTTARMPGSPRRRRAAASPDRAARLAPWEVGALRLGSVVIAVGAEAEALSGTGGAGKGGRPRRLTEVALAAARRMIERGGTIAAAARAASVAPSTLSATLRLDRLPGRPPALSPQTLGRAREMLVDSGAVGAVLGVGDSTLRRALKSGCGT